MIVEEHSIKASTFVEVGCGFGRLTPWVAEFSGANEAVGVDHNEQSINLAQRQYPSSKFTWHQCGAESIDERIEENSVDLVLSWTVLQHLSPSLIAKASTAIQNILSDDGWLVATEETGDDPAGTATKRDDSYSHDGAEELINVPAVVD